MIQWLKSLSDGVKAFVFLSGLLVAGIGGAFTLAAFLGEYRGLPARVTELERLVDELNKVVSKLDDQAVRYGNGVGLKVSYESTIYQLDACISCPDGQRKAEFVRDSQTDHQVYLTKEP